MIWVSRLHSVSRLRGDRAGREPKNKGREHRRAPATPPVRFCSIFGEKFTVACVYRVAAAFRVTKLVLRHIHYEPGDRPYRRVCSCTATGFVLALLVICLPPQTQLKACLAALLCIACQEFHLVLFYTATYGKSTVCRQQDRQRTQDRRISKLPALFQQMQETDTTETED